MVELAENSIENQHSGQKRRLRNVDITTYKIGSTPKRLTTGPDANELLSQKENFLNHGTLPDFTQLETKKTNHNKGKGEIRFDLFPLARKILETVREEFLNGDRFMDDSFGPFIDKGEASKKIRRYLDADPILSGIKVAWSQDITSSAVMVTRGPANQPEKRTYTMVIKDDPTMTYLRRKGILALADHEVGTHFVRFYNDALQPWCLNRQSYKLRKRSHLVALHSEEGLATLATLYSAQYKYLYKPALLYYIACMSTVMGFRELYEHIGGLEPDPDQRWRLVYRVKRALDSNELGGYGKDQCYLAGAVKILLNRKKIDFPLLYTGKLCYDEVDKVKRIIRKDGCLKPPYFNDMSSYHKHLEDTARLNSLNEVFPGFLQCPTIRCPTPIRSDFFTEPLDFLPLSKERRDQLVADKLAFDAAAALAKCQTSEERNMNTENDGKDSIDLFSVSRKNLISLEDLNTKHTQKRTKLTKTKKETTNDVDASSFTTNSSNVTKTKRKSAALPHIKSLKSRDTSAEFNKFKTDSLFQRGRSKSRNRSLPVKSAAAPSFNNLQRRRPDDQAT